MTTTEIMVRLIENIAAIYFIEWKVDDDKNELCGIEFIFR